MSMTPYACAKKVNSWLKDDGVEKKLPPQMFYTYCSKGYIPSEIIEGKLAVQEEALRTWYVEKYGKGRTSKDAKKFEAFSEAIRAL
jgi:hypothetical protein